jgi:hypothetical protein
LRHGSLEDIGCSRIILSSDDEDDSVGDQKPCATAVNEKRDNGVICLLSSDSEDDLLRDTKKVLKVTPPVLRGRRQQKISKLFPPISQKLLASKPRKRKLYFTSIENSS